MTIRYYLRTKSVNANIWISVSLPGDIKHRKKTGFIVDSRKWNVKKQIPDNSTVSNKNLGFQLTKLKNKITEDFNNQISTNRLDYENSEWLSKILTGDKKTETVLDAVNNLIKESHKIKNQKGGLGLSPGRVRIYKTFERKIKDYDSKWKVSNVNLKTVENFKDWLYKKGYSHNYVNSFVSRLKSVCNHSGIKLSDDFKKIKSVQTSKKNILTLSDKDLKNIEDLKLTGDLDAARKWLILGCEMGQRGSDLLSMDTCKRLKNIRVIEVVQEKTGKMVVVPVNDKAWKILKNGFPKPIKLYKFNKLLKTIAYRAKVERWKEVSSHIMRRSFATRYYGKIPTPILMNITGHSKEGIFLDYVGKSSLDNAMEAMEWFKRLDDI